MTSTSLRLAWLLALVGLLLPSCNTMPDKRILQYLNTDGFGNRYQGNAEEENWLAIGDTLGMTDSYNEELNLTSAVEIDGTVLLPELGAVLVAGGDVDAQGGRTLARIRTSAAAGQLARAVRRRTAQER